MTTRKLNHPEHRDPLADQLITIAAMLDLGMMSRPVEHRLRIALARWALETLDISDAKRRTRTLQ